MKIPPTVYADNQEKERKVLDILERLHKEGKIILIYTNLVGGDYFIRNRLIERKNVFDFAKSKRDNRLWTQTNFLIEAAKHGLVPVVLVEGLWQDVVNAKRMGWWEINLLMNEITLNKKIPTIRTVTPTETAYRLASIAQGRGIIGPSQIDVVRKSLKIEWTIPEKQEYFLMSGRGIGKATAKKLLVAYNNILIELLTDIAFSDLSGIKLDKRQRKAINEFKQILRGLK